MSNCINIYNNVVKFSYLDIDIPRFHAFLTSLPAECPNYDGSEETGKVINAWWFLAENTAIEAGKSVTIRFGEGRSSHTGRDFRGLINGVLKDFMLREKEHTFILTDEYDGFRTRFRTPVVFGRVNDKL